MPKLAILRHATAAFPLNTIDHERPLTQNGHRQAQQVAPVLTASGWAPEAVLVSSALRTRQTATWVGEGLGEKAPTPRLLEELYNAPDSALLAALNRLPDGVGSVLLVAHMPGVQELALRLCSAASEEEAVMEMATAYPPAGLCLFETRVPWAELDGRDADLMAFHTF